MAGARVRRPGGDVGAGEDDRAAVARELAAELRHEGGLAGAVRADQGMDLAGVDAQVDAIGRDQAAEALLEAAHVEQRRCRRGVGHDERRRAPSRPQPDDALAREQHDGEQDPAGPELVVLGRRREHFLQQEQRGRADQAAPDASRRRRG